MTSSLSPIYDSGPTVASVSFLSPALILWQKHMFYMGSIDPSSPLMWKGTFTIPATSSAKPNAYGTFSFAGSHSKYNGANQSALVCRVFQWNSAQRDFSFSLCPWELLQIASSLYTYVLFLPAGQMMIYKGKCLHSLPLFLFFFYSSLS